MVKTKNVKRMVFCFEMKTRNYSVEVTTEGTGDEFEDIWNDLNSYVYNVLTDENDFPAGVEEVMEYYPDYNYDVKEA